MARRVQRGQRPSIGFDHGPMRNVDIGDKTRIHPLPARKSLGPGKLRHRLGPPCMGRPEGKNRRAGPARKRCDTRRVIVMGVSYEDMGDRIRPSGGIADRVKMILPVRTRINYSGRSPLQNIGLSPGMGHRSAIGRGQPTDPGRNLVSDGHVSCGPR